MAFPAVIGKKKNTQLRCACDYLALNKITVPMSFLLSHIETVFDAIGDAKANFFTNIDFLLSGKLDLKKIMRKIHAILVIFFC